jgi:hypothetical protein
VLFRSRGLGPVALLATRQIADSLSQASGGDNPDYGVGVVVPADGVCRAGVGVRLTRLGAGVPVKC